MYHHLPPIVHRDLKKNMTLNLGNFSEQNSSTVGFTPPGVAFFGFNEYDQLITDEQFNLKVSTPTFPKFFSPPAIEPDEKVYWSCNGSRNFEKGYKQPIPQNPPIMSEFLIHDSNVSEDTHCVPSISPGCTFSPMDYSEQEKEKIHRKRMRNRIAAAKCRRKKLEMIEYLESKVANLKKNNFELEKYKEHLHNEVKDLEMTILQHKKMGCQFPQKSALIHSWTIPQE